MITLVDWSDEQQRERVLALWLQTNTVTHDFIPSEYWQKMYPMVSDLMADATIYVYWQDNQIIGFIGLMETYIAGIFVDSKHQNQGVGYQLIQYVQNKTAVLDLSVYALNEPAWRFYERQGFKIVSENLDDAVGEIEYQMHWAR
ncbi:Acetyltransferase, GNAT family [Weissella ceti]|uniref:Acetyltransferase, GNAT family n=3 Tax=Lactobacillaceae TaxID=33958 RepID=A0A075TTW7_9LACO|nr:Acetyltransferase, GNAT family [Weissella tructae]AIM62266.1 Acetyltransferase, GNAT family [Weissella ceti]AIM63605.1 Acetyltransferase, GNAT family [Weissella ceti]